MPQLLLAGLFGLIIGSFLNVVIHRLPRGQSLVSPPSTCPGCGSRIRPIDNVPVVSWLLLGGKCHRCHARISFQYPLVELVTGVLFLLVAWVTPAGPLLAARLMLVVSSSSSSASTSTIRFCPTPSPCPGSRLASCSVLSGHLGGRTA